MRAVSVPLAGVAVAFLLAAAHLGGACGQLRLGVRRGAPHPNTRRHGALDATRAANSATRRVVPPRKVKTGLPCEENHHGEELTGCHEHCSARCNEYSGSCCREQECFSSECVDNPLAKALHSRTCVCSCKGCPVSRRMRSFPKVINSGGGQPIVNFQLWHERQKKRAAAAAAAATWMEEDGGLEAGGAAHWEQRDIAERTDSGLL